MLGKILELHNKNTLSNFIRRQFVRTVVLIVIEIDELSPVTTPPMLQGLEKALLVGPNKQLK